MEGEKENWAAGEESYPRVCFIVSQFHEPAKTIYTLRFAGETREDVKRELDEALGTLPFPTIYSYVNFTSTDSLMAMASALKVEKITDYPGAEKVFYQFTLHWETSYFLPRDWQTRKFVDIDKQVQCLSVLTTTRYGPYPGYRGSS